MTIYNSTSTDTSHDHGPTTGNDHAESTPPTPMTREEVRQCLGFNDEHAPAWVKHLHEYKISTFGSGNGQAVR